MVHHVYRFGESKQWFDKIVTLPFRRCESNWVAASLSSLTPAAMSVGGSISLSILMSQLISTTYSYLNQLPEQWVASRLRKWLIDRLENLSSNERKSALRKFFKRVYMQFYRLYIVLNWVPNIEVLNKTRVCHDCASVSPIRPWNKISYKPMSILLKYLKVHTPSGTR